MKVNLHTHTVRCNHATGAEAEYIERALNAGMESLGFSDHTPYFFPGDHYSSFRMRPEQLEDYVRVLQKLRRQYTGRITLHIGVEAEYYPELFPELLPFLQDQGVEYMLLGQHFVGNEIGCHYSGRPTGDPDVLRAYCRQVIDGIHTGRFTYIAHPDLLYFTGDSGFYREQMKALCREAKTCGIPLEYNLLGVREGRHYPNPVFWRLAAELDCPVALGCDAHSPQALNRPEIEKAALDFLNTLGLQIVERPQLRPIG